MSSRAPQLSQTPPRRTLRWNAARIFRHDRLVSLLVFAASQCVLLCGCSMWNDQASPPLDLPTTRMSADSVAIEITFVRIPADDGQLSTELWERVDEQALPLEKRLHLNQNGFRVGLIGGQLPARLRQLLEQQEQQTTLDTPVTTPVDFLTQNRRVNVRSGKRTEIVASDLREQVIVLERQPGNHGVRGTPYDEAQCILATKSYPQGDGSIKLQITPEVHHGPIRNQWVPGHGTFRQLAGRRRKVFQHLLTELQLSPGQSLMLSCTPEQIGVGRAFFVESGQGDAQQKLLLVRLAQTQRDELFDH